MYIFFLLQNLYEMAIKYEVYTPTFYMLYYILCICCYSIQQKKVSLVY